MEKSLRSFYKNKEHTDVLISVLDHKTELTLRNLHRFVTQEAKGKDLVVSKKDGSVLLIYRAYKTYQSAFTKRLFDPFCRYDRIKLKIEERTVETTLGQLNFFRWAIENKVIDAAREYAISKEAKRQTVKFRLDFD